MKQATLRSIAITICAFFVALYGGAQDTHYSQYNAAPLDLNPAFAGYNNCDYRLALNARTQWSSIGGFGNAYNTIGAGADFAVGKVTRVNSFAGIGVSVISGQAGATAYNNTRGVVTFAYHFMLDRRGNSSISAGLQVGVNYRGFNPANSTYDRQFNALIDGYDATLPGETFARSSMLYLDAGVGLLFSQYFKQQRDNFFIGLSINHVNQPNISWQTAGLFNNSTSDDKLFIKTTLHGGASFEVSTRKVWIMPNFLFLFQGPSQEYNFGSLVKIHVGNSSSGTFFYMGAQFRAPLDALVLQTRLDYKGLSVGFSYDINVSKLVPASHSVGAPELAIMYQGCMRKKPHQFLCPSM